MRQILTFLALFWSIFSFSQHDTIVLVNGTKHAVIIKEIGSKEVKYKNPSDSLGPTYIIQKKLIERFILKNGCIDLKEVGYENCVKDPTYDIIKNSEFTRVIFSTDIAQLVFIQHLQFNLEFITKNRKIGIEPLFNIGLHDPIYAATYERKETLINPVENGGGYYKRAYGGLNIKMYPYVHKKSTFFVSAGVEKGLAATRLKQVTYQGIGNNKTMVVSYKRVDVAYTNYHVNTGVVFRPRKHVVLQTYLGVGINQFKRSNETQGVKKTYDFRGKFGIGFMLGFAF